MNGYLNSKQVSISVTVVALMLVGGCFLRQEPSSYPEPERLVMVLKVTPPNTDEPVSGVEFLEWRAQSRDLGPIAAYVSRGISLSDAEPERIFCGQVSADFFPLLGVSPGLGRTFLPAEYRPGGDKVVVISHALWLRRFNGDPKLIGSTIKLDQESYPIIGIMPAGFRLPEDCEIWMPLALGDESLRLKDRNFGLRVVARLKPGVTIDQAQAEMRTIAQGLEQKLPEASQGQLINLVSPAEAKLRFQRRERVAPTPLQIIVNPR